MMVKESVAISKLIWLSTKRGRSYVVFALEGIKSAKHISGQQNVKIMKSIKNSWMLCLLSISMDPYCLFIGLSFLSLKLINFITVFKMLHEVSVFGFLISFLLLILLSTPDLLVIIGTIRKIKTYLMPWIFLATFNVCFGLILIFGVYHQFIDQEALNMVGVILVIVYNGQSNNTSWIIMTVMNFYGIMALSVLILFMMVRFIQYEIEKKTYLP